MAYDTDTYEALHPLTGVGQVRYQQLLEEAADEILFKHAHPIRWALQAAIRMMQSIKR